MGTWEQLWKAYCLNGCDVIVKSTVLCILWTFSHVAQIVRAGCGLIGRHHVFGISGCNAYEVH